MGRRMFPGLSFGERQMLMVVVAVILAWLIAFVMGVVVFKMRKLLFIFTTPGAALIAVAVTIMHERTARAAAQAPQAAAQPGATDIAGVVTGPGGPEAGVWVIAE